MVTLSAPSGVKERGPKDLQGSRLALCVIGAVDRCDAQVDVAQVGWPSRRRCTPRRIIRTRNVKREARLEEIGDEHQTPVRNLAAKIGISGDGANAGENR